MQTIVDIVIGVARFIQLSWRIIVPAGLGFAFGWRVVGFVLSQGQSPYVSYSLDYIGLGARGMQALAGIVGAVMVTVMFNRWLNSNLRSRARTSDDWRDRDGRPQPPARRMP